MIIALLAIGCERAMEEAMEAQIESETGGNAEVDIDGGSMTVETEDGTLEIESSGVKDGWCPEGQEFKMTSTAEGNEGNMKMVYQGVISSGEYAGYCHVTYDMTSTEGTANINFYFNEDGDGYQVMEINGEKFSTEWHN